MKVTDQIPERQPYMSERLWCWLCGRTTTNSTSAMRVCFCSNCGKEMDTEIRRLQADAAAAAASATNSNGEAGRAEFDRDHWKALAEERGRLLEKHQWAGTWVGNWNAHVHCPECQQLKASGHVPGCALAAALSPKPSEPERGAPGGGG